MNSNVITNKRKKQTSLQGEVLRNLNFKISSSTLMKLNILADHEGKFLKDYLVDLLDNTTKFVKVNIG